MKIKTEQEIIADHAERVQDRARLEMKVVNALIARAEAEGCELAVWEYIEDHGDESDRGIVSDFRTAVFDLDVANVHVYRAGEQIGWILLVFGNDGWDLISDYSTRLDAFLAPVNELSDGLA